MIARFKTLHGKLSLALLALLFCVGTLYAGLTVVTARTYLREVNQHLNRSLAADLATHLVAKNLLRDDAANQRLTRAEIKQSMVLNPDIEIYILDSTGRILDYSAATGAVRAPRVSLLPLQRFLAGIGPLPILGDDPRTPGQSKIFSAARIPVAGAAGPRQRIRGYIYIILGGQQAEASAGTLNRSYILRWSLLALATLMGVALLTGALLFRFLTQRLRRLTRSMETFQEKHFERFDGAVPLGASSPNVILQGGDEIERLERVFGLMSRRIEAQIGALQQADAYRREVISNVSHDLRTPLAALQGYLETLQMKEGTLSPAEKRNYLATATRHAQRLGKLVSELFEIARLESGTLQLQLERFSLAELVQDVTQQFDLAAQQKGVALSIDLEQARPFVRGDIGLIERAMENLIDNALRHTPAGGRVTVALMPGSSTATVRVSDSGAGIAPDQLPFIFERYYRAPRQAGQNAEQETAVGAGLGLAITRRIVELHNGTIEVRSTPGEGASFTFTLPVAASEGV